MRQPLLSVLIATLARRQTLFLGLLDVLLPQAEAARQGVEVVALRNCGERPLGQYRDALLAAARGRYLCFVDDDDMVAEDYVSEICSALADPAVDVIGFTQSCTGLEAPLTFTSIRYAGRAPERPVPFVPVPELQAGHAYLRAFTHLQPVRAELARQCSFQGGTEPHTREDTQFVTAMLPRLAGATEVYIRKCLYTYRWNSEDTTQAGQQAPFKPGPRPVIGSPCFRWHEESL